MLELVKDVQQSPAIASDHQHISAGLSSAVPKTVRQVREAEG